MADEMMSPQFSKVTDINERGIESATPPAMLPGNDVVKKAKSRFSKARKAREKYEKPWPRYYKLWAGDHWSGIPLEEWRSKPVVNFIFSTTETVVSTMTDQSPQIVVFPRSEKIDDLKVAEALQKLVAYSWERANGNYALENTVRDMVLYGLGVLKIAWNKDREQIELVPVRIDQVYVDPTSTDFTNSWYVFHVYTASMNDIIDSYPDKAKYIRPGTMKNIGQFTRDTWESPSVPGGGGFPYSGTSTFSEEGHLTRVKGGSGENVGDSDEEVTVMEYWERDPRTKEVTVHYICNEVLLETIESPFGKKVARIPFVRFVNHPTTGEFYCVGEVQELEPLQLSINRRRQQIIDNLRILGNPPIIADNNSGLEEDVILNHPGELLLKNPGTQVNWMNPPAMPSGLFEVQQFEKQEIEAVSGIFDVVQGKKPSGIEAASAIAALQEAAQTRIRRKTRRMEDALREVGELMVLLIQGNYTDERIFNLVLEDGSVEALAINQEEPQELDLEELKKTVDEMSVVKRAMDITKGEYFVQVKAGSTLPISKTARLNEAVLLFDRQIVDSEEVLTAINHPRKQEILGRLQGPVGGEGSQDILAQLTAGQGVPAVPESPLMEGAVPQENMAPQNMI